MTNGEQLTLAREIHDRVVQRLCGVSLVLESAGELDAETRERCGSELSAALAELRALLSGALPAEPECTFGELLRDAAAGHPDLPVEIEMAPELEHVPAPAAARHFVEESLRNVVRHAHPKHVIVAVGAGEITVYNDGVLPALGPPGVGLRLLRAVAADCNAELDYGADGSDGWRTTLTIPAARAAVHA